jgi:hypothetical protein
VPQLAPVSQCNPYFHTNGSPCCWITATVPGDTDWYTTPHGLCLGHTGIFTVTTTSVHRNSLRAHSHCCGTLELPPQIPYQSPSLIWSHWSCLPYPLASSTKRTTMIGRSRWKLFWKRKLPHVWNEAEPYSNSPCAWFGSSTHYVYGFLYFLLYFYSFFSSPLFIFFPFATLHSLRRSVGILLEYKLVPLLVRLRNQSFIAPFSIVTFLLSVCLRAH